MIERGSGKMGSADGVLEDLAYGVAVAEADRRLSYVNRRARELLMPVAAAGPADAPLTCCEAIGAPPEPVLGGGCLSERARAAAATLPEVRMDIETGTLRSAAWVTASPAADGDRVVFHLRPGQPGDRRWRTEAPLAGRSAGEAADPQM